MLLNGCLSSDEDPVNEETAELRVVHASPDTPAVDIVTGSQRRKKAESRKQRRKPI